MADRIAEQDRHIAAQNAAWFAENSAYAERVGRLKTYQNIRAVIDREIDGTQRLLDVGNGGVFDYDVHRAREIVAVDLFVDEQVAASLPGHVTLRRGDALALDELDEDYDAVLLAFVFHHLTGTDAGALTLNIERALDEAHRVLRPGGRLIVVEACIPRWFFPLEKQLFKPLVALSRTPLLGDHPPTLQVPVDQLRAQVASRFAVERVEAIPVGKVMLQFGRRWPVALTPARPWLVTAKRS